MSTSSPRQKRVLVVAAQPSELEQKKKRQTLERAKANHLSRQLQMRLQYAKLKVEHGWQRQNLNEVENLYFHHSHLRHIQHHHVPVQSPAPSPSMNDRSSSGSQSPPAPAPIPVAPSATHRPPSALDLSDPNILARLAQLQAQVQMPSQSPSHARQSSATTPSTSTSTTTTTLSAAHPVPTLESTPAPGPGAFSPPVPIGHPQPRFPSLLGPSASASVPGSGPLYPVAALHPVVHNPAATSQSPASTSASTSTPTPSTSTPPPSVPAPTSAPTAPNPSTPAPAPAPAPTPAPTSIASTALTYDSFWSTHASSSGPTRTLYRTHTGFSASATPGGNVAMLAPGGHAAVITTEGVYVGGANGRSG